MAKAKKPGKHEKKRTEEIDKSGASKKIVPIRGYVCNEEGLFQDSVSVVDDAVVFFGQILLTAKIFLFAKSNFFAFLRIKIRFGDQSIVELEAINIGAISKIEEQRNVMVAARGLVPKKSEILAKLKIPAIEKNEVIMLLQPSTKLPEKNELSIGNALVDCSKTESVVLVMNVGCIDQVVLKGTFIGHLVLINQASSYPLKIWELGKTLKDPKQSLEQRGPTIFER